MLIHFRIVSGVLDNSFNVMRKTKFYEHSFFHTDRLLPVQVFNEERTVHHGSEDNYAKATEKERRFPTLMPGKCVFGNCVLFL